LVVDLFSASRIACLYRFPVSKATVYIVRHLVRHPPACG